VTQQEEQYIHFVSSIDDLNSAWRILQEIKRSQNNSLVGPAFQFALIEYSKPYRTSYGVALNAKGKPLVHKLDGSHVPAMHLDLHNRLLTARDKIHAHSDLTVMEAKLYVARTSEGQRASIVQNVIYGWEEVSNIDLIIDLIEQTLDSMYVEVEQLEASLPSGHSHRAAV
jgi:hypothetical protein